MIINIPRSCRIGGLRNGYCNPALCIYFVSCPLPVDGGRSLLRQILRMHTLGEMVDTKESNLSLKYHYFEG